MPDREKVIKALEAHCVKKHTYQCLVGCPYQNKDGGTGSVCADALLRDIYNLIQEGELIWQTARK